MESATLKKIFCRFRARFMQAEKKDGDVLRQKDKCSFETTQLPSANASEKRF